MLQRLPSPHWTSPALPAGSLQWTGGTPEAEWPTMVASEIRHGQSTLLTFPLINAPSGPGWTMDEFPTLIAAPALLGDHDWLAAPLDPATSIFSITVDSCPWSFAWLVHEDLTQAWYVAVFGWAGWSKPDGSISRRNNFRITITF